MRNRARHRGFTLVEMLVSMSVSAVLMTGLASALFIAARAIPDENSIQLLAGSSFQVTEQLATELATAISLTAMEPNVIEFQVPDRTSDINTTPETIRYEWSGTNGDDLIRTFNGTDATILSDIHDFTLGYGTHDESTTSTQTVEVTGAEGIVAYFDGWSGVTPNTLEKTINNNNWVSEALTVTPPTGTTKIKFTKARVWMRRDLLTVLGTFTIQLYRSTSVGGYRPGTLLVDAPAISGIGLPLTAYWATATFNETFLTDLSRSDYLLMVKGTLSDGVWLSHYQHNSAPSNGMTMYYTSNGGGAWSPTSNLDRQDMRYYLYASYVSNSEQEVNTTTTILDTVRISIQPGSNAAARIDAAVMTHNQPNVTGL